MNEREKVVHMLRKDKQYGGLSLITFRRPVPSRKLYIWTVNHLQIPNKMNTQPTALDALQFRGRLAIQTVTLTYFRNRFFR